RRARSSRSRAPTRSRSDGVDVARIERRQIRGRPTRISLRSMRATSEPGDTPMNITVGKKAIYEAAEKLKNCGRWRADDQTATLDFVTPQQILRAAALVRTGGAFALGIPLDRNGPQSGLFGGRWNPIHTMLATGTDAAAGRQDKPQTLRYSDDAINMPVQSATHWDSLGHIFLDDRMYNGLDARLVDANALSKLGIEHPRAKMTVRGGLIDVARHKGVDWLPDGHGISNQDLDDTARAQGVEIRRGDFV